MAARPERSSVHTEMIHRAVIVYYDEVKREGLVIYAHDPSGTDAIDAIAASLMVGERRTARWIKHDQKPVLGEHKFTEHAAITVPRDLRQPGQIVQVITDKQQRVVYVRREPAKDE